MKKILFKNSFIYFFIILLSIIGSILIALFGLELGLVIDSVVSNTGNFIKKVLNAIYLISGWFLLQVVLSYVKSIFSNRVLRELKDKIFTSLIERPMHIYIEKSSETYLNILTRKIDLFNENFIGPITGIVGNFISAIVSITAIYIISWKLGISFTIISLFTIILSQIPSVIMIAKTKSFSEENGKYLEVINNYLKGYEQIKLLGIHDNVVEDYKRKDEKFENSRKSYIFVNEFASNLGIFFSFLAQLMCMGIGIYFVNTGNITIGSLIAAINLLNTVFSPIQQFVQRLNLIKSVGHIKDEFEEIIKSEFIENNNFISSIESISISNLSFQFNNKVIFENLNLFFQKNRKYVIKGESGRGKSTLAKILLKYFQNEEVFGKIKFNDISYKNLSTENIYENIAYIQRNEFYINGSVEDNIKLGREYPIERKLLSYLKFEEEFLKRNIQVLATNNISMGQKQRIDIARFLIKDYDVIIFDEPTSNLDSETSNLIWDLIFKLENKIVIVISHIEDELILSKFDEVINL